LKPKYQKAFLVQLKEHKSSRQPCSFGKKGQGFGKKKQFFLLVKIGNNCETSSYQQPTSTGLDLQYGSATPSIYKFNLINCLLDRAYKINSTYKNSCAEFQYL